MKLIIAIGAKHLLLSGGVELSALSQKVRGPIITSVYCDQLTLGAMAR